jgi:mRNA-degrading endonuclease RelE of RelBE toxin-antitoxin system
MRYAVRVPADLSRLIANLHPEIKRKLRAAIGDLAQDAGLGKPLTDRLAGYCSLRVGKFRLIYRIAAHQRIELLAFGPRETIYQETLRLISGPRR